MNDPEEQERLRLMEQEEAERNEREIRMWEERDRVWLDEAAERKRREEAEEDERRKILEELKKKEVCGSFNFSSFFCLNSLRNGRNRIIKE